MNLTSCTVFLPVIDGVNNEGKLSHEQEMAKIKNKSDAVRNWGVPQKKDNIEGVEIWYYELGSIRATFGDIGGGYSRLGYNEISGVLPSYVELHFQGDKVVHWRTKGVNLSQKKDLKRSAGVGLLIDALLFSTILLAYVANDY